jgi:integrase
MRKGEVQALTWKDIDFNLNEIIVNKTLYSKIAGKYTITSTKNNRNRIIKMSKTLKEQLATYKNKMMKYSDFSENWFVFGCSRFLPLTNIDRYKHKYFQLADVDEITIHEFRHSHVSLLINEYVKSGQTDTTKFFLMMSNRMGHTIDVMQKTYMHLFPTIQNEIVDILDNL